MNEVNLPVCPTLRATMLALNDYLTTFTTFASELEDILDKARAVPKENAAATARNYIALGAQENTTPDEREALLGFVIALMRVHRFGIRSTSTGEAIGFCEHCGEVNLVRRCVH